MTREYITSSIQEIFEQHAAHLQLALQEAGYSIDSIQCKLLLSRIHLAKADAATWPKIVAWPEKQ